MRYLLCSLAAVILAASTTFAQTTPDILFRPWPTPTAEAQVYVNGFGLKSEVEHSGQDVALSIVSSRGRFRIIDEADDGPAFGSLPPYTLGYEFTHIGLNSDDPLLPNRLVDLSMAYGFPIGEQNGWQFSGMIGAGSASDEAFRDADGIYAKGYLFGLYQIDQRSSWLVSLAWNGNRTIFPDLPLPGVQYNRVVDETLSFTAGLPISSVRWTPVEKFRLTVEYLVPINFEVNASYELFDRFEVFGAFDRYLRAFHVNDDDGNRRHFLRQSRLEAGIRWAPIEWGEVILAGGYAFGQKLERGWSTIGSDTVRDIDDAPYFRFQAQLSF